MSSSLCAMQRRAIAELMCQKGEIPFVSFAEAEYAFYALADEGCETIDHAVANLKAAAKDEGELRTAWLQQAIENLKSLKDQIEEIDDELPEQTWPDDLKDSLRAMLASVDCTTAAGQAEMRGMVRALAEFGLVSQPDSSIGKVA